MLHSHVPTRIRTLDAVPDFDTPVQFLGEYPTLASGGVLHGARASRATNSRSLSPSRHAWGFTRHEIAMVLSDAGPSHGVHIHPLMECTLVSRCRQSRLRAGLRHLDGGWDRRTTCSSSAWVCRGQDMKNGKRPQRSTIGDAIQHTRSPKIFYTCVMRMPKKSYVLSRLEALM